MIFFRLSASSAFHSPINTHSFISGQAAWQNRLPSLRSRSAQSQAFFASFSPQSSATSSLPPGLKYNPLHLEPKSFSELSHRFLDYDQHIKVNRDFEEALRHVLSHFRPPICYAFAYGSGVFGQGKCDGGDELSPHPHPPRAVEEWQKNGAKIIDFIFGVSHTQHWHSVNLGDHPDHYSGLKHLPYSSGVISHIQDRFGAGVYFNPFITVNGIMIKYGVVNIDTLRSDLSAWDTLYLAGRLQKPVKILRDDPRICLANQINLKAALGTSLLMLPEIFSERQLYECIAGLSYVGDPRMNSYIASENPNKVSHIVGAQLPAFRQLYVPLIQDIPNVMFIHARKPDDTACGTGHAFRHTDVNPELNTFLSGGEGVSLSQDLDPVQRGEIVRHLPKAFKRKLYLAYLKKTRFPGSNFAGTPPEIEDEDPENDSLRSSQGGEIARRIAAHEDLPEMVARCVRDTVAWPAMTQSVKSAFTAGVGRSWRYYFQKRRKGKPVAGSKGREKKEC